ncbi:APC family permease [Frankia sp. CNm7]|uniref:APC family permease n=1 Tax=Frankia nepalensis TaxID=1836974 RepID=A0A937RD25_9ACTN|nr:APC family permease [Frankia nepalensis]MBL7499345.1 APC family permease [Frankia nepalensis]MBL7515207.1 APC family permease [Frankia nepalensis]MBL7524006.1 APC family permease [Frankia nepalensis]MBL7629883.1 APC family permease [Frankia nepalensis]
MALTDRLKRGFVGRPLGSDRLGETLLPKRVALPVFASDALSSVSYATEEILLVLSIGGLAYYHFSPWIALAVVVLMMTVVASYRQNVHAYPSGGGDYEVATVNLGDKAGLTVASALLVDYVLTVAVSISAGVANLASAATGLAEHKVIVAVVLIVLLTMVNLRGVRESGTAFAIPTYAFIVGIFTMIIVGLVKVLAGDTPRAESADYEVVSGEHFTGLALAFLALRAFSSGCTALTGVEAISNGVPAFRKPKSRNAATTLLMMGLLATAMFIGVTALALISKVHVAEDPEHLVGAHGEQATVIAQVAKAVFGDNLLFVYVAAVTTLILILAANTAFNGFPVLGSILARDGYLPRQLHTRGDRLAYSNGILLLAGFAILLVVAFKAETTRIIQLYIVGVFVSFTLSQIGMVRHWQRILRDGAAQAATPAGRRKVRRSQTINFFGACMTGLVLILVLVTKFTHGAYIVCIAMPVLFLLMRSIRRHYDRVRTELAPPSGPPTLPSRVHGVVLVSKIHAPTLRALAYAKATRPYSLVAVTAAVDQADAERLTQDWHERGITIDLVTLASPYREITGPVLKYVADIRRESPRDVVAVFVPEYVVGHWWEHLLHNQSALRLKARLLFQPGVMVTSVPWQLESSSRAHRRYEGAAAGAVRRGQAAPRGPVAVGAEPTPPPDSAALPAGKPGGAGS